MASAGDDVRLPFSTLDSIVGDVFSVHWEPEMMNELGNALKILTSEVLSSVGTSVLGTTMMMGGLMSGLSLPIGESLTLSNCSYITLMLISLTTQCSQSSDT